MHKKSNLFKKSTRYIRSMRKYCDYFRSMYQPCRNIKHKYVQFIKYMLFLGKDVYVQMFVPKE